MIDASSTLEEVAFEVCTALGNTEITAVLTVGSAATVYAPDAIQLLDLDFVLTMSTVSGDAGAQALAGIGFIRKADYYVHPKVHFPVEFPAGPLMIGDSSSGNGTHCARLNNICTFLQPQLAAAIDSRLICFGMTSGGSSRPCAWRAPRQLI